MDDISSVVALLTSWIKDRKVGSIHVNLFKGGITTINLNETIKLNESKLPKGKDRHEKSDC